MFVFVAVGLVIYFATSAGTSVADEEQFGDIPDSASGLLK